jgi:hypothetical protein
MAEHDQDNRLPTTLAERFEKYRTEVQQIVTRGLEHPRYELKRSATISREQLPDRLDFVKLIQGLANAHIAEERFIIIGADKKERKFYDIENAAEFDPAKVSQVLSKYLDPQPRFEVFNDVRANSGESYVLIVLSPDQPRPIVVVCEGSTEKRLHFRLGDIWIKKNTNLQTATRADLNTMYEDSINRRVDEEAESRARRRFEHFRDEFGSVFAMQAAPLAPTPELLVGTKPHLLKFVEITIATGNVLSFKMLLEMGRERLVDRWDLHQVDGPGMPVDVETWITELAQFYQDEFVPALESSVHLGMQIIKYDASPEWLSLVVEALIETFETCRRLDRLKSSVISANSRALNFSRPAYEVYIGIRTLATYAFMRKRTKYLKEILPRFVRLLTQDNSAQAYVPILFWPFSGRLEFPDMRGGRNLTLWNERIQSAWGSYFGTFEKFLNAASQLEFVLEFNSYVFEVVQNPQVNKLREEWGEGYLDTCPIFGLITSTRWYRWQSNSTIF